MKKFKFLPSIIMLAVCFGIFAVAIFAIQPYENHLKGSITIHASENIPVDIELYIDSTQGDPIHVYEEVRHGEQIDLRTLLSGDGSIRFNTDNAHTLSQVPPRKVILRIINRDTNKKAGAYYLNKPLSEDSLITINDKIYDNTDKSLALVDVTMPSYTILNANNAQKNEPTAEQDLTLEFNMATWENGSGDFKYYLYIEEFTEDKETYYEETTHSNIITPSFAENNEPQNLSAVAVEEEQETSSIFASTILTNQYVTDQLNVEETPYVVVPEGIDCIDGGAFDEMCDILYLTLPSTLTEIGSRAFNCLCLMEELLLPDNVEIIGAEALGACEMLTHVKMPRNLLEIGEAAFSDCTALEYINIPSSVGDIYANAFQDCESLQTITIPENVSYIGTSAFSGCKNVTEIYYNATNLDDYEDGIDNYVFYNVGVEAEGVTIYIGSNVTRIPAFFACPEDGEWQYLKNVIFKQNSVCQEIGLGAFYGCVGLQSIEIPASVVSIDNYAFSQCYNLTNVAGMLNVKYIAEGAYRNCTALTNIALPKCINRISEEAFAYCTSLQTITIPEGVNSIGSNAFVGCSSLEEITLPFTGLGDTHAKIGKNNHFGNIFGSYEFDGAVEVCGELNYIENGHDHYDDYCFYIPSSLTKVTFTGEVVEFYAFANCTMLTEVILTENIKEIKERAFDYCCCLETVYMPEGLISIRDGAFTGCESLTPIEIPNSVTTLGSYLFDDFDYDYTEDSYGVKFIANKSGKLLKLVDGKGITTNNYTIPSGVTSIGNGAFSNCTTLTSITIPDSVTSIGGSAFYGCTSLASITIPDSVTSISVSTFYGCTSLTSITIPDSVTSIGDSAFYGCTSLTGITIPDSVTSIGGRAFSNLPETAYTILNGIKYIKSKTNNYFAAVGYTEQIPANAEIHNLCKIIGREAFYECTSLTSITIPDSVTSIGSWAFYGCTSLTSITIPDSVTIISRYAFYGCTSLTSITIPDSVTSIGGRAFFGCASLASITIPDGVTSIGYDAFYDLPETAYTILNGIKYIKSKTNNYFAAVGYTEQIPANAEIHNLCKIIVDSAFSGCTSLTSITIPDSVTSIGYDAFVRCTSLETIIIPDSVTSIGDNAFYRCTSLYNVTVLGNLESIGYYVFLMCENLTEFVLMTEQPPILLTRDAIPTEMMVIYVPKGSINAYKNATNWSVFANLFVELNADGSKPED